MELIPKFQNKGKLPVVSNKGFNRKTSEKTTEKSDTTSKVSSGKTSSEVKRDHKISSNLPKTRKNNSFTQINDYDMPWVVESKQRTAAEEEAYQKDMSQPYYTVHEKPTKEQWRKAQAKAQNNQGTITAQRKVLPVVRTINNYIGEAKHSAQDGSILLKGKYTIPMIGVAGLIPWAVSAPVTAAATMGGGYVGKKVVDIPLKIVTGKNWGENISNLTGLAPEAAEATNIGMLVGGGLPFVNSSVKTATSIGDQFVRNIPVKDFISGTPKFVKDVAGDVVKYGFKEAGGRALETYFPSAENVIFKLPYETQEQLYPLRQYVNHKIIYPRENARYSAALERMRMDPALQGKPDLIVDLRHVGGDRSHIGLVTVDKDGGLRSIRAMLNPGIVSDAEKETVKNAMKKAVLREWNKNKQPGDIITGDARRKQDPINTVSSLNLQSTPYNYSNYGLSSDSYALVHSLARRGTGRVVFGREPMGLFNPLAEDGVIYGLQEQYANGKISPLRYAIEAEKYFRNNGVRIRQPYIVNEPVPQYPVVKQQVLFSHPSYVEGLTQYMK